MLHPLMLSQITFLYMVCPMTDLITVLVVVLNHAGKKSYQQKCINMNFYIYLHSYLTFLFLSVDSNYCPFISGLRNSFSISCRMGLLVTNSLQLLSSHLNFSFIVLLDIEYLADIFLSVL